MKKLICALLLMAQAVNLFGWHGCRSVQWDRLTNQERAALVVNHNVSLELALLSAVYFGNTDIFEYLYRVAFPVSFTIHFDGRDVSFADCIAVLCNTVVDDFEMQKMICDYFATKGDACIPSCNDYAGLCISLAAARDAMYAMYDYVEFNQPSYCQECNEMFPIEQEVVTEILSTILALFQAHPAEDHQQTLAKYAHVTFTIAGLTMNFTELAQFIAFEHEYIAYTNKAALHDIMAECPELGEEGYERLYRSRLRWHMTMARRAAYNVDYIKSMCL